MVSSFLDHHAGVFMFSSWMYDSNSSAFSIWNLRCPGAAATSVKLCNKIQRRWCFTRKTSASGIGIPPEDNLAMGRSIWKTGEHFWCHWLGPLHLQQRDSAVQIILLAETDVGWKARRCAATSAASGTCWNVQCYRLLWDIAGGLQQKQICSHDDCFQRPNIELDNLIFHIVRENACGDDAWVLHRQGIRLQRVFDAQPAHLWVVASPPSFGLFNILCSCIELDESTNNMAA